MNKRIKILRKSDMIKLAHKDLKSIVDNKYIYSAVCGGTWTNDDVPKLNISFTVRTNKVPEPSYSDEKIVFIDDSKATYVTVNGVIDSSNKNIKEIKAIIKGHVKELSYKVRPSLLKGKITMLTPVAIYKDIN